MRTVKPQDLDAARKSLSWLCIVVENYDVEQQLQLLVVAVGDQEEVARMKSNVSEVVGHLQWRRWKHTVTACWTLVTQQFVGPTRLLSTFAP
ncbi:hypothetical protein C8035_v011285 [Colletotrichum spinosum]|uniref:Uncharacterized protein n=1 Tax=Colletotrichum spinosum TaxID=1347390 RepID=A0A4R8PU90_9PEZI|nr:hypothetical protein C8035_v011285 [Colletotrichum spinosum]